MPHKRRPTAHQQQVRFLAICVCILMILAVVGVILLLNQPQQGYHWLRRFHHH